MRRWTAFSIILLLALGIAALFARDVSVMKPTGYSDFVVDYVSAREWQRSGDAYGLTRPALREHLAFDSNDIRPEQRNPHPPFQIVLVSPLARLPYGTARLVLLALSAMIAVAAAVMFLRDIGKPAWWGLGVLALPVLHAEFFFGQLVVLSLLLLVLAWRRLQKGDERTGGLLIGLAAALKLFPVLMLLPLLRGRRYTAALWLVLGAAGSTLAASAILGPSSAWRWLTIAFPENSANFAGSASPASWLFRHVGYSIWISLVAGAICAVMAYRSSYWKAVPWVILASPIVWAGYGILTLPLIATQAPISAGLLIAAFSLAINPFVTAALLFLAVLGIEPVFRSSERVRVIDLQPEETAQELATQRSGA